MVDLGVRVKTKFDSEFRSARQQDENPSERTRPLFKSSYYDLNTDRRFLYRSYFITVTPRYWCFQHSRG